MYIYIKYILLFTIYIFISTTDLLIYLKIRYLKIIIMRYILNADLLKLLFDGIFYYI